MDIYIRADENGEIEIVGETEDFSGMAKFEVEDGFDLMKLSDYVVSDGQLVFDGHTTAKNEQKREEREFEEKIAKERENAITVMLGHMTSIEDEEVDLIKDIVPYWVSGRKYKEGSIGKLGGSVWRASVDTMERPGEGSETWEIVEP